MKCNTLLSLKGFNIPDTQVDVNHNRSSDSSEEVPNTFSQKDTKSTEKTGLNTLSPVVELNMKPTVLLLTGQVDKYFQQRNLDLTKFVSEPKVSLGSKIEQAEKFKSSKTIERTVTPITIHKQNGGSYVCSASRKKKSTEKTKEEHKVASKKAKCDPVRKESKSTTKPLDPGFNTISQMQHQISKHLTFTQCTSNDAIKSKQNSTTESSLRNNSSTSVATDVNTQASTNIPDTSKEHKRKSVSIIVEEINNNGGALNETISTSLISNKNKGGLTKANVRIRNDKTIDLLPNNLNSNKLIHSILSNIRFNGNTKRAEKMLQTTQPSNNNICYNSVEDTCKIKGLKDHLRVFKIPVNVSNGSFHMGFRFNNPRNRE